nr:oligosaccharide flippase family protein [Haliscomenobacter sp.]
MLHPTDYGFIGLIVAVSSIALIFQDFGLGSAIVQKQHVDQQQLSTIFFLSLGVGLLLCLIVYFTAPLIAAYYQEYQLTQYFRVSVLGILFGSLNVVPSALVQKKMLFKQQALRNAITTIFVGSVTVKLAYSGWGIWSLMLQVLLISASTVVINFFITKWHPLFYFRLSSIREIMNYSRYVFLSNVSNVVFTRIDTFIIPKVFNLSILGFYSRAQQMDNMVRNVSSTSIIGVLFPYFSTIIENDELVLKLWERYYNLICLGYF